MDKNETIAQHIWHDILQNSRLPFGWHFEFKTVKTIENGTSFRVNTDYIIGEVEIQQEQQGSFKVTIKPDNYGGSLVYNNVVSDNLVYQINRVVKEGVLVDNRPSATYRIAG